MTMQEAMLQRHMVRKYSDTPLPDTITEQLNERLRENNQAHDLCMKLMRNNDRGVSFLIKILLAKGVKNYIILAGSENDPDRNEKLGYAGADMMLFAQTLGLNTWWVGGTYNRQVAEFIPSGKVAGILAIGYGKTQGVAHKSKSAAEVSSFDGDAPAWFSAGIEAALLAPTALNKQDFMIHGSGRGVSVNCKESVFSAINLGLVKYHFELGAGKENFDWVSG